MVIKILFVFGCPLNKGGTENVMINICKNIDRDKFHVDFLIFDNTKDISDDKKFLESLGCVFYSITARKVDRRRHNQELDLFFKTHKYDIVHTHMDAIGEEALRKAKKYHVASRIAHSHNTDQLENPNGIKEWLHKGYLVLEKYLLRHYANYYIACSDEAGLWLFGQRICEGADYLLLNNAIDARKYEFNQQVRDLKRKELGIDGKKVIIHVGQFRTQKNHKMIISIFNILYRENNDYKLILVGDGEERAEIEKMVSEKGLDNAVDFLGNRTDVSELLQAADLFIFPSLYEGLGIALLEAEASDLPCVVSNTIPGRAIITDKVKKVSLDAPEKEWSLKVEELFLRKEIRHSRVEDFINYGFDIESQIRILEDFYRKSVNNG